MIRAASRILGRGGGRIGHFKNIGGRSHQNYSSTKESARSWGVGGGEITPSPQCSPVYTHNVHQYIIVNNESE